MSRWSPVYVPEIETGIHVKNNTCAVEIKIKWIIRKHMTYKNIYRDDIDLDITKDFYQKHIYNIFTESMRLYNLNRIVPK